MPCAEIEIFPRNINFFLLFLIYFISFFYGCGCCRCYCLISYFCGYQHFRQFQKINFCFKFIKCIIKIHISYSLSRKKKKSMVVFSISYPTAIPPEHLQRKRDIYNIFWCFNQALLWKIEIIWMICNLPRKKNLLLPKRSLARSFLSI